MTHELRIFANMRIFLIAGVALSLLVGAYDVFAQEEEPDIEFPIAELGNCANKEDCKVYCDEIEHISQCVDFAERHGLMRDAELDEAKKVARALAQGVQLPGGCRGKEECETYCSAPSHIEECLVFAEAAGFMSTEELETAKRVAPLMAQGEMPGQCRSKKQCEEYCSDSAHIEECAAFFQKAGFVTAEEGEMFRKTGGKGPGNCRGKEECETFCNNPANQEACFAFAKEHRLIPEEELQHLEEGIQRFRQGFDNAPPEVRACLESTLGIETLGKLEGGSFLPNPEIGMHMRRCFEQHLPNMIEQRMQEGMERGGNVSPEAADCVWRILGDTRKLQGPPSPEQEQRIRQECFPQTQEHQGDFQRTMPPEGMMPHDGQNFDRQYQEEFRRQYEQQYQQQYQQKYQRQLEQQTPQPPPQEFHSEEPLPQSSIPKESFLGAMVEAMRPGLRILFPFLPL